MPIAIICSFLGFFFWSDDIQYDEIVLNIF